MKRAFNPDVQNEEQRLQAEGNLATDQSFVAHYVASPLASTTTKIKTAITDDSTYQVVYDSVKEQPAGKKITATSGGVSADIKAVQVVVYGTDANDQAINETLPVFTVNTPTTVTGALTFKTITKVIIPAHDGTGATTSIGFEGGEVDAVMDAFTDVAVNSTHTFALSNQPDVPRALTATAGGTAEDIKAIQVKITGLNQNDEVITETLTAFTENTAGTVTGAKAFAKVTKIEIPVHDGNGATTAVGTSDILGLAHKLSMNTTIFACLNKTREGTAPTVAVSATALESNTIDLNSALNGNQVDVFYFTE